MNGRGSSFHVWLRIRVDLTGGPGKGSGSFAGVTGRAVFEWVLGGQFPGRALGGPRRRFTGEFSADGGTISCRWETSRNGSSWEHDFDLTYRKVE